jgi:hypothetical protein
MKRAEIGYNPPASNQGDSHAGKFPRTFFCVLSPILLSSGEDLKNLGVVDPYLARFNRTITVVGRG